MYYIKDTGYSYAVCIYNRIVCEFCTYEEAEEYLKGVMK